MESLGAHWKSEAHGKFGLCEKYTWEVCRQMGWLMGAIREAVFFSRESDSRDGVVRLFVRPSVRHTILKALKIKSFSSVMNKAFLKRQKSSVFKRYSRVINEAFFKRYK